MLLTSAANLAPSNITFTKYHKQALQSAVMLSTTLVSDRQKQGCFRALYSLDLIAKKNERPDLRKETSKVMIEFADRLPEEGTPECWVTRKMVKNAFSPKHPPILSQ